MPENERRRTAGPLAGVRVLDLTRLLPGPVATLHLADLGADVVKIEDTATGDYARDIGDGADGVSWFYRAVNRNKRGMRLDLKQPAGREILLRLVERADLVVESFRPGVMDRLGVGFEVLRARNPSLVYCAITGYGQDGPWAQRAGHDLNYIAQSGVLDQTGTAGGAPAIPSLQIGDLLGGAMSAVAAILAALYRARATGEGAFVDVAMAESVLAHNLFSLFAHAAGKAPVRGADLLTGGHANYAVYRTRDDRYLAVGALEEKFWAAFCAAVGRPEWQARHGDTDHPGLREEVAALIAGRNLAEWQACFDAVDCCVTPVLTFAEAIEHPQFRARGMSLVADGMTQLAPPFRVSGWEFELRRAAPAAGEHTDELLAEAGYDAAGIASLRQLRIV